MIFSILTATYNRAHTLPELYASLKAQQFDASKFEWLIMDDGSKDNTEALVKSWKNEGAINIRFFKQKNGGHHRALNGIIPKARGRFSIILDSDDTITPNALGRYLEVWESIPEAKRDGFAGVSAQCMTHKGNWIGKPFPSDIFDSNNLEIKYVYKLSGDRKGFIRTEIQKAHLYPEFEGEKFISDSVVWHKIGQAYKTRYINEALCATEYLEDGQIYSIQKLLCRNAKGSSKFYQDILNARTPFSLKIRLGIHAYYVRYSLHAGYSWSKIIREGSSRPVYLLLGSLVGGFLYLRDEIKDVKEYRKNAPKAEPAPTNPQLVNDSF
ncbi:MAG: glycosyltransferase family 2 protein [Trueperaceae bacterium]|nr:glycosyltransferase family 2 protein [Trueperaceae bacterium]